MEVSTFVIAFTLIGKAGKRDGSANIPWQAIACNSLQKESNYRLYRLTLKQIGTFLAWYLMFCSCNGSLPIKHDFLSEKPNDGLWENKRGDKVAGAVSTL